MYARTCGSSEWTQSIELTDLRMSSENYPGHPVHKQSEGCIQFYTVDYYSCNN